MQRFKTAIGIAFILIHSTHAALADPLPTKESILPLALEAEINTLEAFKANGTPLSKSQTQRLQDLEKVRSLTITLSKVTSTQFELDKSDQKRLSPTLLTELVNCRNGAIEALQSAAQNPGTSKLDIGIIANTIISKVNEAIHKHRESELSATKKIEIEKSIVHGNAEIKDLRHRWVSMYSSLAPLTKSETKENSERIEEAKIQLTELNSLPYLSYNETRYRKLLLDIISARETTNSVSKWIEEASPDQMTQLKSARQQIREIFRLHSKINETRAPLAAEELKTVQETVKRAHDQLTEIEKSSAGQLGPATYIRDSALIELHQKGAELLETNSKFARASLSLYDQIRIVAPNCLDELTASEKKKVESLVSALEAIQNSEPAKSPCCALGQDHFNTSLRTFSAQALRGFLAFHQLRRYFEKKINLPEAERLASLSEKDSLIPESYERFTDIRIQLLTAASMDPSSGQMTHPWVPPKIRITETLTQSTLDSLKDPTREDVLEFCKEAKKISKIGPGAVRAAILETLSPSQAGCLNSETKYQSTTPEAIAQKFEESAEAILKSNYEKTVKNFFAEREDMNAVRKSIPKDYGLKDEELEAIRLYTDYAYREINAALREGGERLKIYLPFVEVLKRGLNKLPDFQGLVRRGATLPPPVLGQHQVGQTVTYPSFVSTSYGEGFKNAHRTLIYVQRCKNVDLFSKNREEMEVICLPGTRFKVLERNTDPAGSTVMIMKEVAPGD